VNLLYCLIGLGNPGAKYHQTRHNAGFLVIDQLLEHFQSGLGNGFQSQYSKVRFSGQELLLVKPQTYMNLSGEAVVQIVNYYKIPLEKVLVIYDDLDLPVGALRFRTSGSAGGHNGVKSIIQHLNTTEFARVRIGIGRPPAGVSVPDFVLTSVSREEQELFQSGIRTAAAAALAFVEKGPVYTMNHFNSSKRADKKL